MERKYCDRCGQELPERHCNSWIRYYDKREVKDGSYSSHNYSYGSFVQEICGACLDDLKPIFHSKVDTEPAGIQIINMASSPIAMISTPCTGCWLCRLKRFVRDM
jgi:hypothetical protein